MLLFLFVILHVPVLPSCFLLIIVILRVLIIVIVLIPVLVRVIVRRTLRGATRRLQGGCKEVVRRLQ